jgi:hypothetical protein
MSKTLIDLMADSYFDKDEVKRHAYVELMTLKTLLIAKGVFTEQEFDSLRIHVDHQIHNDVCEQIEKMKEENPKEAAVMNVVANLFKKPDPH